MLSIAKMLHGLLILAIAMSLSSCEGYVKLYIVGGKTTKKPTQVELVFVTQPAGPYASVVLQTQPVLHIMDSESKELVTSGELSESVISLELIGAGTLSGTTNVSAKAGVARFSDLIISEVGDKQLKAFIADTDTSATSDGFSLITAPSLLLTKDDLTPDVFCPRIKVEAADIPEGAVSYCIQYNSDDPSGCTFSTLNFPFVTHSTHHPKLVASIWYKNQAGDILANEHSNELSFGARQLPGDKNTWLSEIKSPSITARMIDELLCRVDELTHPQALATANIRLEAMTPAHRTKLSSELNRVVTASFGVPATLSVTDTHKVLWRLLMSTDSVGEALHILDLSQIDLTGRHIGWSYDEDESGFDFSGSNLKGHQLNNLDLDSWYQGMNLSGLDLTGWNPSTTQSIWSINYSNATNIPWAALNANIDEYGFNGSDFSGVNLAGWNPGTTRNISYINYNNATNIPWAALNANTHSWGFQYSTFSGVDLTDWNPGTTRPIYGINYSNATNIPWAALNANTHANGFNRSNFSGVDLTGWNPGTTRPIDWINYSNATNIPWTALNSNTHANGFNRSNFSGVDLTGWNPGTTRPIDWINYSNATNIPWTALNSNTHANGFNRSNFSGVDLTGWNPGTTRPIDWINYSNATNLPWAALNANTHANGFQYSTFSGVDLTGWNPGTTQAIFGINYSNATNIPWAALNANTHSWGFQSSIFSGVDLTGWNPGTTRNIYGINYSNSTNIPWAALNANTHADGFRNSNFSGVDLTGWNPGTTQAISWINYSNATNIPWAALNANTHANGFSGSSFGVVDLSEWVLGTDTNISNVYYTDAKNIPWSDILANDYGLNEVYLYRVDLDGLDVSGANLEEAHMPRGARNPQDFEEAIGMVPGPGTVWVNGSSPWD
jgi:hypothetical protein